ncbi:hypothetical protein [Roseateles chitinivorans]|uniref:hypothetical protein n=1 Tax=Roseateles chitinivorans TaxID=2917965 RepID=UPI003D66B6B8
MERTTLVGLLGGMALALSGTTATADQASESAAGTLDSTSAAGRARQLYAIQCLGESFQVPVLETKDLQDSVTNTLLTMRFNSADTPPDIHVTYNSASEALLKQFVDHALTYRAVCLTPQDKPVIFEQHFHYTADGARSKLTSPLPLKVLLDSAKKTAKQAATFDLDAMGCPFDVKWALLQPAKPNDVSEWGPTSTHDPRREPFLKWLATLELDLPPDRFERLFSSSTRVQVPCGSVSLMAAD